MKIVIINLMRATTLCLLLAAFEAGPAYGQHGKLRIDNLDKLAQQAVETVDVTVDESLLQLAAKFLKPERSPNEKLAKEIIADLKGVYVKRFVFKNEKEYSDEDVESIRSQLTSPGWAKIVNVRSKRNGVNVDIHLMTEESVIRGLAVVVAEAKALTVVNVVGPIDIEKLSKIEGRFGIPRLDIEQIGEPRKEEKQ